MAEDDLENSVQERQLEGPATTKAKQERQRQGVIRKLWWRAHWLFPNALPGPYGKGDREYRERRDSEANAASRVPVEEELRVPVIWGAELFGPAEAEALYASLTRLKWSSGGGWREDGAADWIRHQRSYGAGGGWYNVDVVVRQQDRQRWLMLHNFAQLPDDVDHLRARFFQITPSLTCALVGFVLKDEAARSYERELNKDRKSIRQRSGRGWSISTLDPSHRKRDAIQVARARLRAIAGSWFKDNMPGYFCGRSIDRLPTAELITTKAHRLLSPDSEAATSVWFGWQRLIANTSPFDVWTSEDCQGLQLSMSNNLRADEEQFHMVVSLCTEEVPDKSVEVYGGRERTAYVSFCHERLDGILSNYAALAFLREASKDVRSSRSELTVSKLASRKCVHVLDQIQSIFDRSLGAPAVAAELRSRSEHLGTYRHECSGFFAPAWPKEDEQRHIAKTLQEWTNWLSARVIAEEHSAREHFAQLASILSVRESVRAQQRMEWLTVAALVVATASLIAALPSLENWLATIRTYVLSIRAGG